MAKPESCRYLQSHEWAALEGGQVVVGLSDHAQKEITDVVFVDLPKVGRKVKKGESVASVESVKAAFDFYAPVSGEVVAVNAEVSSNPAVVNLSPHEKGWFFKLAPADEKEMSSLMDFAAYQEFLKTAAH
ncbi:MAG: glycine cleavage system protein GcvH [Elusimicrobiota bacterium]|jgi:glycine cleavage system H protein